MKIKKLLLTLALAVVGVTALSFVAPKAHALSGGDFNPGRIIDDSVFFNKDAMSVNDIQNFLLSKVSSCQTNHAAGSGAQGATPPWTCLYQYRENTTTHANNIGSPGSNPAGSITAAQIIYDSAQTYNISPKVLLVLIQKESSLITDDWPYPWQYRSATGYGCPDTAPCDSQYYGFYNQVNKAAFQYRRYATYPNEYNFAAGRNNNIGYNPNGGCGYQTVYIQNQATAGLYNYTPYVPNAAALNNLYGTGDGCSAYGNRNFWRLYSDWFGSTTAPSYAWQYVSQSSDQDLANMTPGQEANVTILAQNTGTQTWFNTGPNQINVVTDRPMGRTSSFQSTSWLNQNTPTALVESSVAPGQNGTFRFKLKAPGQQAVGSYNEYFSLVAQNITYFNDIGQFFRITVKPAYTWSFSSQAAYTDSTKTTSANLSNLAPNQTAWLTVRATNTGNMTWTNTGTNRVSLVTDRPFARASNFATGAWLGSNTPVNLLESSVAPGQTGTFEFPIQAPSTAGTYKEYFNPIVQNLAQMNNDIGQFFRFIVQ